MRYYVVTMMKEGSSNPCSIFGYNTREEACSVYHNTLASAYVSATLDAFSVVLLNEHGGTEMREYWERPMPEPNEE